MHGKNIPYNWICINPAWSADNLSNKFIPVDTIVGVWAVYDFWPITLTQELWHDHWSKGWTSIVPFVLNGAPHLLEYKSGEGTVAIDRINANGQGTTELWRDTWSKGWTSIAPFILNSAPHQLEYKSGDGTVAIDRINANGQGTTELWRDTWSRGWTSIVPFVIAGEPYLLEYKATSGTVAIDKVRSDGKGTTELSRDTWLKGSIVAPFVRNGEPHVLEYVLAVGAPYSSGAVVVHRVNPGGTGTTIVGSGRWTLGWNHIVPFDMNGKPYLFEYKSGDGAIAIDRVTNPADPDF